MSQTSDLSTLKGKSVLITGGASGLGTSHPIPPLPPSLIPPLPPSLSPPNLPTHAGLATALSFSSSGASVTILDISSPPATASHIPYIHTDVSSYASQLAAFKTALSSSPQKAIDAVILFAGVASQPGNLIDHVKALPAGADPPEPSTKVLDVNLTGVYYGAYLALHYRVKALVLVASLAAYVDYPGHTQYVVSKFGVRGLFRSLRAKGRKEEVGTRVNLVAPWVSEAGHLILVELFLLHSHFDRCADGSLLI